jgi:hypothetical protein
VSIPPRVAMRAVERLFPAPDPYAYDPVGWAEDKCKAFLWSKQKVILESIRDYRYTAVPSCHGPGKSFIASVAAAWWNDVHPSNETFVVTTAPTDSQVKAILWREIRRRHRESSMSGYITKEAHWYAGNNAREDELIGYGRKPQDYNMEAFQGIHAKYVLIIIDEGAGVSKALFDALETLMTNEYARLIVIGNPDDPSSHFEQVCRPGSGYNVIRIPAFETPAFTGEFVPKHVLEDLVSPMWVRERKLKWGIGSPLWQSKVMAQFPEITNDTLITPNMVIRAQAKEIDPWSNGCYAWDVARFGPDETTGYRNQNGHIRKVFSAHKQDTFTTANIIQMHLLRHGADYVPAIVDVVGVGGGVVDNLHSRDLNVIPFSGGESANEDRRFANRRAESYWIMREEFEKDLIDIDYLDEDLASQLQNIKWKVDRRGRILIESKDDMKRRGLPSPDRADCAMMSVGGLGTLQRHDKVIPVGQITSDLLHKVM